MLAKLPCFDPVVCKYRICTIFCKTCVARCVIAEDKASVLVKRPYFDPVVCVHVCVGCAWGGGKGWGWSNAHRHVQICTMGDQICTFKFAQGTICKEQSAMPLLCRLQPRKWQAARAWCVQAA